MKNKKFGNKNQRLVLTRKQPNKTTEQKPSPSASASASALFTFYRVDKSIVLTGTDSPPYIERKETVTLLFNQ